MSLVTFRLKNIDNLVCDSLDNFSFKLNDERQELEIYKGSEYLGDYLAIYGIREDDFIKYIQDLQVEVI